MAVQILISVAMCTLNGEKYLQEQLDSIAAQTVLPSEIVICDDGSRDRTIEIIQTFAATTSIPIHLHFNMENLGVAHNFFKAIKLCKSDWVMLCDQDDVWTKERVSIFGDAIKSNISVNVILTDGKLVDCNMKFLNQTLFQAYRLTRNERASINTGHGFKVLVRHLFATGAGMTIRKSLVLSIPEPVEDFLHDEWMIWFACPNLLIIDKPTFFYRQHSNQVTGINGRLRAQYKRFQQPQQKSTMTIDQGIRRFQILESILMQMPIVWSTKKPSLLLKKIDFLKKRNSLSTNPGKRLTGIIFSVKVTNYWRFASGIRTLIKDITGTGRL